MSRSSTGSPTTLPRGLADAAIDRDRSSRESRCYGGAQLVYALDDGYCAASDHRKEGCAVGY